MKFQSHVPSFMDVDPPVPLQEFASVETLLQNQWVKSWNKGQPDFQYYWSRNDGRWSKAHLMAMWTEGDKKDSNKALEGKTWYVLGYMDQIPTTLPRWPGDKE